MTIQRTKKNGCYYECSTRQEMWDVARGLLLADGNLVKDAARSAGCGYDVYRLEQGAQYGTVADLNARLEVTAMTSTNIYLDTELEENESADAARARRAEKRGREAAKLIDAKDDERWELEEELAATREARGELEAALLESSARAAALERRALAAEAAAARAARALGFWKTVANDAAKAARKQIKLERLERDAWEQETRKLEHTLGLLRTGLHRVIEEDKAR